MNEGLFAPPRATPNKLYFSKLSSKDSVYYPSIELGSRVELLDHFLGGNFRKQYFDFPETFRTKNCHLSPQHHFSLSLSKGKDTFHKWKIYPYISLGHFQRRFTRWTRNRQARRHTTCQVQSTKAIFSRLRSIEKSSTYPFSGIFTLTSLQPNSKALNSPTKFGKYWIRIMYSPAWNAWVAVAILNLPFQYWNHWRKLYTHKWYGHFLP